MEIWDILLHCGWLQEVILEDTPCMISKAKLCCLCVQQQVAFGVFSHWTIQQIIENMSLNNRRMHCFMECVFFAYNNLLIINSRNVRIYNNTNKNMSFEWNVRLQILGIAGVSIKQKIAKIYIHSNQIEANSFSRNFYF